MNTNKVKDGFVQALLTNNMAQLVKTFLHWGPEFGDVSLHPNTESCGNHSICTRVTNYPTELVKKLLNDLKSINITKLTFENLDVVDGDFENICSYKEEIFYPLVAKNTAGTWKFILNGNSFQGFVVELCKEKCEEGTFITTGDYKLDCVQKFNYRKMLYLDMENREVAIDSFEVPSCCSCGLIKKHN
ncbi:unnamed protein product [Euphydryas editha]|uniref:Spaetzle domain-containing protein n=1 Tax=Euphydryas editha TaxID=104508 RepID=A0AAU9V1V4_EUPED|nr:unnamed protein product [Euphydryas editha]